MPENQNPDKIKQDVVDHLIWDDRIDASNISVDYDKDTVILNGSVDSYSARHAAEMDAHNLKGVLKVENNLNVNTERQIDFPTDEELKKNIEDSIYWNNRLDYSKIDVIVNNKIVTLIGSVNSFWKKNLAEDLAYSMKGTANVINKISVVPTRSVQDHNIAESINGALERNPKVNVNDIDIKINEGMVTLSGKVNSWEANNAAYEAAKYAKGVVDVTNEIVVTQDVQP